MAIVDWRPRATPSHMTLRRRLGSLERVLLQVRVSGCVVGAGRAPELVLVDHDYNIWGAS